MNWLRSLFGGRAPEVHEVPQQNLTDIARGMQHAVNAAAETAEQHHLRSLQRFFVAGEDGVWRPQEVQVEIAAGHVLQVPLVALTAPQNLGLKKVRVRMAVRIDDTTVKQFGDESPTRCSFKVSFAPRDLGGTSNVMDMTMEFEAGDPPEAVARIMDMLVTRIEPRRTAT